MRQEALLRAAESDSTRLVDVFGTKPRWREFIVTVGKGLYALPPVPSGEEEDEG